MNSIDRLGHILGVIFDPRFWIRNHEVSDKWSDKLEQLMQSGAPVEIYDDYLVKLGGFKIWIRNWPYAFGSQYKYSFGPLPRRKTAIRLRKYIQDYCVDQFV